MATFDVRNFVYAHRGLWSDCASENGLPAFRAAAGAGIGVELDVRLTRDGEPVVFHDQTLLRMCGDERALAELPWNALSDFRLPDGSSIPHLMDALAVIGSRPVLVELKVDAPGDDRIADHVAHCLQQADRNVALMSFDVATVRTLRRLAPCRPVGLLIAPRHEDSASQPSAQFNMAREVGCDFVGPHVSLLEQAAGLGLPMVGWTVKEETSLRACMQFGAAPIFEQLPVDLVRATVAHARGEALAG